VHEPLNAVTAAPSEALLDSSETFPLRRSFVEQVLGHAVSSFQFTQKVEPNFKTSTMAGAVAYVSGPLGELEFDVHTMLQRRFRDQGCPEDKRVRFSLKGLERERYASSSAPNRENVDGGRVASAPAGTAARPARTALLMRARARCARRWHPGCCEPRGRRGHGSRGRARRPLGVRRALRAGSGL
jgi:hypothetical protein